MVEDHCRRTDASVRPIIRAVLLDLDGTLVDTESLSDAAMLLALRPCFENAEAWDALYHQDARHRLPWDLKKQILGRRGSEWAPIVIQYATEQWGIDAASAPTVQQLWDAWEGQLNELCQEVEACTGAYELVERFARRGVPMAIATSSRASAAETKLRRHPRLAHNMATVVAGDDPAVKSGKPAPDIYVEAARRLDVPPESCLVFEDALSGCQAGKAAGCVVVAVPDDRFTELERAAFEACADVVISALHQFDESKFEFGSSRG